MSRAAVIGLARSGRSAALLLARRGWDVTAIDASPVDADELVEAGIRVRAPFDGEAGEVDLVVKSPGVPGGATPVAAAKAAGIPVWSEVELAARELPNPLICITGTNGKTTTTELTAHLLRESGVAATACGNQGTPLTGLVDHVDPSEWLVVECSSFQLEDVHDLHPRAAALLNISPDHLDRHGTFAAYREAKLRLFARMGPGDLAICPQGTRVPGNSLPTFVVDGPVQDGAIAWSEGGLQVAGMGLVAEWGAVSLRGRHNRCNAMVATVLAARAGATPAGLARGLAGFPGVAHRLERVAERAAVVYVNDSKATNPDAAAAALDAYDRGVHLIAGGSGKGTSFAPLADAAQGAVVRAYLIGESAAAIGEALDGARVPNERSGDLATAVRAAAAAARPGECVLLAPACASFDQFRDYEQRGEVFRAAVADLGPA